MKEGRVKFAVMADIHLDIMHDGMRRLDEFLRAADKEEVDFVIHLGDFAYPNDTSKTKCDLDRMPINVKNAYENPASVDKEAILRKYNEFHRPTYHTMGNHDFDFLSPEDAIRMYGIPNGYYSFHMNGWHFIVLDGNYWRDADGNYVHYDCGEYFYKDLPYMNPEQLEWLRAELRETDEPVIMFSHQMLCGFERHDGAIKNSAEFLEIIDEAKSRGKDVRMCVNGHLHIDRLNERGGTLFYNVNSISNYWVDTTYEAKRYSDKTEERFPNLRYTLPYSKPVFAIVTLDDEGICVKGMKGKFVYPGPRQLGINNPTLTPHVKSWERKWDK